MSKQFMGIDYYDHNGKVSGYIWGDNPQNAKHFKTIQAFLGEHRGFFEDGVRIELVSMTEEQVHEMVVNQRNQEHPRIVFATIPLSVAAESCGDPVGFLGFVRKLRACPSAKYIRQHLTPEDLLGMVPSSVRFPQASDMYVVEKPPLPYWMSERGEPDIVAPIANSLGTGVTQRKLGVQVQCCARCGGDHLELVFEPLSNHDTYSHWALCPEVNQPVLLRFC